MAVSESSFLSADPAWAASSTLSRSSSSMDHSLVSHILGHLSLSFFGWSGLSGMAFEVLLVCSWGITCTERSLGLWCASCLGFSCVSPDCPSERCACIRPCPHLDLLWCILSPLAPLQIFPQLHLTSHASPVKVVCLSLLCVCVTVLVVDERQY